MLFFNMKAITPSNKNKLQPIIVINKSGSMISAGNKDWQVLTSLSNRINSLWFPMLHNSVLNSVTDLMATHTHRPSVTIKSHKKSIWNIALKMI